MKTSNTLPRSSVIGAARAEPRPSNQSLRLAVAIYPPRHTNLLVRSRDAGRLRKSQSIMTKCCRKRVLVIPPWIESSIDEIPPVACKCCRDVTLGTRPSWLGCLCCGSETFVARLTFEDFALHVLVEWKLSIIHHRSKPDLDFLIVRLQIAC